MILTPAAAQTVCATSPRLGIFSSFKYLRTCALTSILLSLLLQHLLFPLHCLPQLGKEVYLLSVMTLRDNWT
jgi:hypothetical protein